MEGDSEFDTGAAAAVEPEVEEVEAEVVDPAAADAVEGGDAETIDLLVNADELGWYQALSRELEAGGLSSFKVSKDEMTGLPLEAQQLVHNAVQMARRAADKAARKAQDVSQAQETVAQERRQLAAERAQMHEFAKHPAFQEFLTELKPKADADPWSAEGREAEVRGTVGALFQKFIERMASAQSENEKKIAESEQAHQQELRTRELEGYIEKHQADFDDEAVYGEIKGLVERFRGAAKPMTAQEAHQMVMRGRAVEDPLVAARRAARTRTGPTNGSANGRAAEAPEDFIKAGRFYAENPEALERDLHKHLRDGTGY